VNKACGVPDEEIGRGAITSVSYFDSMIPSKKKATNPRGP
jgi:hypothetical protein